jgi:dethiobiotin synthetase
MGACTITWAGRCSVLQRSNRDMSYFLTGTDTGVGKTRIAAMLVRKRRAAGVDAVGFKPICCGDRADAERLREAAHGSVELNEVNPVWLRPPLAPYAAAMVEGRMVDLALIRETFTRLRTTRASVIVEGVGGWLVPIAREFSMADLAVEFGLPVLVVAANRLGAINHTLLTVRAVKNSGLECAGVILNQVSAPTVEDGAVVTNRGVMEELLAEAGVKVLGEVEYGVEALPEGIGERLF